jgi:uncharacterized protein
MSKVSVFTVLVGALVFSPFSISASFDCGKAGTLVEQTVCTNKQLSDLDSSVGAAYKNALKNASNQNDIKNRQRDWLQLERNNCRDIACLKSAYTSRLAELNKKGTGQNMLSSDNGEVIVPENQKWIIEGFRPYVSERGVGTADLYFDGSAQIDGKYNISGKFDITVGSGVSAPIVVDGGTKITIGDSRGKVAVKMQLAN